jgi:hypothetical protein
VGEVAKFACSRKQIHFSPGSKELFFRMRTNTMIKALAPLGFAVGTYMWARHDLQPSLFPLLQMVSKMSVCAFVAVITTRELFDRVCTSTEDDTTFLAWTEAPKQFIRDVPWWYPREN